MPLLVVVFVAAEDWLEVFVADSDAGSILNLDAHLTATRLDQLNTYCKRRLVA